MKILYHHRIASKDGQYVHVEEIIKSLRVHGHEVIVVAPAIAENKDFGSDGGWVSSLRNLLPQFTAELLEFGYCFYAFIKLCIAIIKEKPDCIYERYNLFLPSGMWAAKLFNKKIILEVNAPLLEERSKYSGLSLKGLARWSQRYCWKNADKVLPVTDVLADYIRNVGVEEVKIDVIANGINVDEFINKEVAKPELNTGNKLVLGFVGFCREWHGLNKVIDLIAQPGYEHLFFVVVGEGPVRGELIEQASALNVKDRFHFTGLVPRSEMPKWLEIINIALQPSVVPYASPLKMLEYMAKGKAIVAPDTANIKELLVDEENALLFEEDNIDSLCQKIKLLVDDEALRSKVEQNAKQSIFDNQLTWDNNAKRIVKHFTVLCGSH